MRSTFLAGVTLLLLAATVAAETTADPNFPLVRLPADFRSQRVTMRVNPAGGETFTLLDAQGPGCVRHFWITLSKGDRESGRTMRLKIVADDATQPQVDMRLDHFFAIMLDQPVYPIESAPIKVLPRNGLNCYLPIPFSKSCRITLTNEGDAVIGVWSMVNWHQYKSAEGLTPYRLHAVFHEEKPAEAAGAFPMARIEGRGFVAGMVKAVREVDRSDRWYHTGGDLWLIDGETDPHALRGIGGEDVFGYSFGVHQSCSQWTGTPLARERTDEAPAEIVAYRFFGPDSVAFDSSLVLRFGSKANDIQSVVYYYRDPATAAPAVESPGQWTILGPFSCKTADDFAQAEFPEKDESQWPESWRAGFGQYRPRRAAPVDFRPAATESDHTWVDFTRHLRAPTRTNVGTQPVDVSAYAATTIAADKEETVNLVVGFDDWLRLWINGEFVAQREYNRGFATTRIPVRLRPGENRLLLKLSNFDNQQWRLWAFSLRVERE